MPEDFINILRAEHEKLLASQRFIESELDYGITNKTIPELENLSALTNSAIMLYDLYRCEHIYVSGNIFDVLSLDRVKTFSDPGYIDSRIHPEDRMRSYESGFYFFKYCLSLPSEKRKSVILVNEYRVLSEEGIFVRIIEQQFCFETDRLGNLWLALGIMSVSPYTSSAGSFRSILIDNENNSVYAFPPANKELLLKSGINEIKDIVTTDIIKTHKRNDLFDCVKTVNSDRKKILEDLKVENNDSVMQLAIKLGII